MSGTNFDADPSPRVDDARKAYFQWVSQSEAAYYSTSLSCRRHLVLLHFVTVYVANT